MDVVAVFCEIAPANCGVEATREVVDEIVYGPVESIFGWVEWVRRILCVSMAVFFTALVGYNKTPKLAPYAVVFPPSRMSLGSSSSRDFDAVLRILPKDTAGIDREPIVAGFYSWDFDRTVGGQVGPVLVSLCVEHIVVEVDMILRKNDDWPARTMREFDPGRESPAA